MRPKQITNTLFFGLLAGIMLLLMGCSEMGTQPPVWKSGLFSPDGKYYVYTWTEMFITQYSKRGNSTFRSGNSTTYLQVMDCATGKKMLDTPLKSPEILTIADIENNHVWLVSYEISKRWAPALFDLDSLKLTHSAEDLIKINPDIPMKMQTVSYFKNNSGKPGAVFEATDGRQYLIDPQTGKYSVTVSSQERIDLKDEYSYQTTNRIDDVNTEGGTRKKLSSKKMTSVDDFIDPQFLALGIDEGAMHKPPTIYKNHFLVFSPSFTTDKKVMQLTSIDKDSLTTQWSITLPQNENEDHQYGKERFFLGQDKLFFANTSNLGVIDLQKGIITATYPLFDTIGKS